MYFIFSDRVKELEKEIDPWTNGYKDMGDRYETVFKENTPQYILDKYVEYLALLDKEFEEHTDEREYQ